MKCLEQTIEHFVGVGILAEKEAILSIRKYVVSFTLALICIWQ